MSNTAKQIAAFCINARKTMSDCAAIRATTKQFPKAERAEIVEALTGGFGLKLNQATVRTQIQVARGPGDKPKAVAKKAPGKKAPGKKAATKKAVKTEDEKIRANQAKGILGVNVTTTTNGSK